MSDLAKAVDLAMSDLEASIAFLGMESETFVREVFLILRDTSSSDGAACDAVRTVLLPMAEHGWISIWRGDPTSFTRLQTPEPEQPWDLLSDERISRYVADDRTGLLFETTDEGEKAVRSSWPPDAT